MIDLEKQYNDVYTFMRAFNQQTPRAFVDANVSLTEKRFKFLEGEYHEWQRSEPLSDDMFDGLLDIMYIAYGNLIAMGLKLDPMYARFDFPTTARTIKKISIDAPMAMALFSLRKVPLCPATLVKNHGELLVNCISAGLQNGFDMSKGWDIVHTSNMTKLWTREELVNYPQYKNFASFPANYIEGTRSIVVQNIDGYVIKPPSFRPPNLRALVIDAIKEFQDEQRSVPAAPASAPSTAPAQDQPKSDDAPVRRPVRFVAKSSK